MYNNLGNVDPVDQGDLQQMSHYPLLNIQCKSILYDRTSEKCFLSSSLAYTGNIRNKNTNQ